MDLLFNTPLNSVSFGQVSYNLLKAAKKAGHNVLFLPIGPIDLSTINPDEEFKQWILNCHKNAVENLDRNIRGIKLWHLVTPDEHQGVKGSYDSLTKDCSFISFYELDSPTKIELNVARQFDTVFTSSYTSEVFAENGVKTRFIPVGFDSDTFKPLNKKYFSDDRITFAVVGKFENRKHHQKIIQSWVKRFGNDRRYYLQMAVYNPFFNPQMNANIIQGCMGGKHYWNVNPVQWIPNNKMYNDFLNSNNIVIGMSGGEGWGLPEFQSVGIGKHAVILNAHAYKDWANTENAVLVTPLNKRSAVDGVFFKEGAPYNQGNIFDWDSDEFISACEDSIERYKSNPINQAGLEISKKFTFDNMLNQIINL